MLRGAPLLSSWSLFLFVSVLGCAGSGSNDDDDPAEDVVDDTDEQGGEGGAGGEPGQGGVGGDAGTGGSMSMTTGGQGGGQGGGQAGSGGAGGGAAGMGGMMMKPPEVTPVSRWGQLKVCGTRICDKNNNPVQLKGPSSMWLNWEDDGYAGNRDGLRWMRDNWNMTVIRAAMGIEPANAYLANAQRMKNLVETTIQNAIDVGVYVIVDWHDHNAHNHQTQAVAFFTEMAQKWGMHPNVIWETWNEPLQVSWSGQVKPYHQAAVAAIRGKDPDNLIILGTPQWSQRVDEAANDPVSGTNLLYTLHFYSCTHTGTVRGYGQTALSRGLPLFVTEWGATHADGGLDGRVCLDEAQRWLDWMAGAGISWAAWKLDDCEPDSSCLLRPGAPINGGWTDNWLRGHGAFVRDRMKN